jgi:hypothetical protein
MSRYTGVMSSRLCKNLEGAIFPFQVKSLENGMDNAIHALHIHKADHGPGPPTYFDKTTLDHVGGAQFSPQVLGKHEKRE